jgi:hypothetical protein
MYNKAMQRDVKSSASLQFFSADWQPYAPAQY